MPNVTAYNQRQAKGRNTSASRPSRSLPFTRRVKGRFFHEVPTTDTNEKKYGPNEAISQPQCTKTSVSVLRPPLSHPSPSACSAGLARWMYSHCQHRGTGVLAAVGGGPCSMGKAWMRRGVGPLLRQHRASATRASFPASLRLLCSWCRFELGDGGVVVDDDDGDLSVGFTELESFEPELVVFAVGVPTSGRALLPGFHHAGHLRLPRRFAALDSFTKNHGRAGGELSVIHG